MKLSKREKILLVVVAVLIAFAAYYFYYLKPFFKTTADIKAEISKKSIELTELKIQNGQVAVLEKNLNELQAKYNDSMKKIPTGFHQPDLLTYVSDLISANGEKTNFVFEMPRDLGKVESVHATLNFNTNYDGLKKILAAFKTGNFNNRITSMLVTEITEDKMEQSSEPSTPPQESAASDTSKDTETKTDTKTSADAETKTQSDTSSQEQTPAKKKFNFSVVMEIEFFNLKAAS